MFLTFRDQITKHINSIEVCRFRNKDSNATEEHPSLIRAILELATVEQGAKRSLVEDPRSILHCQEGDWG